MRRLFALLMLGILLVGFSGCEESSTVATNDAGDDGGGSGDQAMSLDAGDMFGDDDFGEEDGGDGGLGMPSEDGSGDGAGAGPEAYEGSGDGEGDGYEGFSPLDDEGPPEGWQEGEDGGYEGFNPLDDEGPPEGWQEGEDGGYEGVDPLAGEGPPEGFGEGDGGDYPEGFDPSGGGPPEGFGEGDGGYPQGFDPSGGGPPDGFGEGDGGYPDGFDPSGAGEGDGNASAPGPGGPPGARGGRNGGADRGARAGGADRGGNGSLDEPVPDGYEGDAQMAFREGSQADAFAFLYALALVDEESRVIENFQWSPGLKRPVMAVQFGVGIQLSTQPRDFSANPYPIGSNQALPQVGRGRSGRGGGGNPYGEDFSGEPGGFEGGAPPGYAGDFGAGAGGGNAGGGNNPLDFWTGELGDQMADRLAARIQRGDYGSILQTAWPLVGDHTSARRAAGGPAAPGDGGDEFGNDLFDEGDTEGGAGAAAPGLGAPPGGGNDFGGGGGGGFGGETVEAPEFEGPASLMAGVTLLGTGSSRQMKELAEDLGLDVLFLYDVDVRLNRRTGLVTNETKIQVLDVRAGEDLHRTRTLNNVTVQRAREEDDGGRDADLVNQAFDRMFEALDDDPATALPLTRLPEGLTAEHVRTRVGTLISSPPSDATMLSVLAEIKFYHSQGLLDDELLTLAFQRLLGELPGAQLAQGTIDERMQVVERWLP